jgi:hypothetical protein
MYTKKQLKCHTKLSQVDMDPIFNNIKRMSCIRESYISIFVVHISLYTSQLTMCSYSFNHHAFLTFIRNICFLESLDLYSRESSWSAILLLLYQFVVLVFVHFSFLFKTWECVYHSRIIWYLRFNYVHFLGWIYLVSFRNNVTY